MSLINSITLVILCLRALFPESIFSYNSKLIIIHWSWWSNVNSRLLLQGSWIGYTHFPDVISMYSRSSCYSYPSFSDNIFAAWGVKASCQREVCFVNKIPLQSGTSLTLVRPIHVDMQYDQVSRAGETELYFWDTHSIAVCLSRLSETLFPNLNL